MKKLSITLTVNEQQTCHSGLNPWMRTNRSNRSSSEQNGNNCITASICIEYEPTQTEFLNQTLGLLLKQVDQRIQSDIEMDKILKEVKDQY
ncbi:hypothetical protein [Dysgonomonas sp. 521]|uniref:hypothetical protein n=1 Tax=Dysgonomonas sp. 521 TaxID=2302932 RepID=UPI0013D25158|nr:hypothetical protein [Dysgonomonas sp. 521]